METEQKSSNTSGSCCHLFSFPSQSRSLFSPLSIPLLPPFPSTFPSPSPVPTNSKDRDRDHAATPPASRHPVGATRLQCRIDFRWRPGRAKTRRPDSQHGSPGFGCCRAEPSGGDAQGRSTATAPSQRHGVISSRDDFETGHRDLHHLVTLLNNK